MKYEISKYTPPVGKLLIKPLKMRERQVETIELDHEANKDLDPMKDEMTTKRVKSKAPFEYQLGEIVASGDTIYPVGGTIVYSVKFVKEFDLFKDTFLVSNYDIFGRYLVD
jgi:hypothetical protein